MERKEIIKIIRKAILQSHIAKAYLFGSFARSEKKFNDIDIAIEPPKGFTLMDLARLANNIEEKTGISVDIVTTRSIHPQLKPTIMKEMVAI